MRTILCLALLVSACLAQDMIITGALDGTLVGGTPKAIEFYVINNIPDLSVYGFGSANNGGGSDGEEFTFPAVSASAGDFIYVASEAPQFTNYLGFPPTYTSGAALINGDDAIELFESGIVVDVFGDINVDGSGEPWEYTDGWAYRVSGSFPSGSTFIISEWTFSNPNAVAGCTTNAACSSIFPLGSFCPASGCVAADPHFEGFNQQMYDFHGVPNSSMAIYSDLDLQVNAFVSPPLDPLLYEKQFVTVMTRVGILLADIGTVEFSVYPTFEVVVSPMFELVDGVYLLPNDLGMIRFVGERHSSIEIMFAGRYVIVVEAVQDDVNPEQLYIDLQIKLIADAASEHTHGVLGQTMWKNDVMESTGLNGEGLVDGGVDDYLVSSLLASDFAYTAFEAIVVPVVGKQGVSYDGGASSSQSLNQADLIV